MFPYLVINATSLFFHNCRFGTPPTKKDIVNEVKEWTQNVPLPPLKKQRISATGSTGSRSTSSKANPNLKKTAITAIPGTAKSTSCAIVIDSTTEVLKKRPALGTKRRAEDLKSTSDSDADNEDEGTAFNLCYERLDEDEDDTLEQADAALSPMKAPVAAQMSKVSPQRVSGFLITLSLIGISLSQKSIIICHGITAPAQEKKPVKRLGNKELPNGALDNGRWLAKFILMFLRYISGTKKDAWMLDVQDAIPALQGIWNEVYKGSTQDHQMRVKHLVQKSPPYDAVYNVVCQFVVPSLTISSDYSQSYQRAIEWQSLIGSNGLMVVGDFFDLRNMDTIEEQQDDAESLLKDDRYIYLRTMEVELENGEIKVQEATISISACPLKVIQVKCAGRYWGPLVVRTMAQCWVDFDGAVEVPGIVEDDDFPYAALALSATSVRLPFCMTLNIFMIYRCTVPSGCGPEDILPRRATPTPR